MPPTARYAALARLLVRHGRADLVGGVGIDEFGIDDLDADEPVDPRLEARAESLTADLEALGPTYIKLGQLLSTRFDLLPAAYTDALTRLQDTVGPFPSEQARATIEADLGMQVRHLYVDSTTPRSRPSPLGQVHRARLRSGREVVVKVQRPDVRETIRDESRCWASGRASPRAAPRSLSISGPRSCSLSSAGCWPASRTTAKRPATCCVSVS